MGIVESSKPDKVKEWPGKTEFGILHTVRSDGWPIGDSGGSPRIWLIYLTVWPPIYLSCSLSCSWWSHQDSKNHKKELSCFPILNYYSHLLWTHGLLLPWFPGAGILLTKGCFSVSSDAILPIHAILHCPLSLHHQCFSTASYYTTPSKNTLWFCFPPTITSFLCLWNKSSQRLFYTSFLHSLIHIHLKKIFIFIRK